jgi:hypothetical protein
MTSAIDPGALPSIDAEFGSATVRSIGGERPESRSLPGADARQTRSCDVVNVHRETFGDKPRNRPDMLSADRGDEPGLAVTRALEACVSSEMHNEAMD